MKMTVYNVQVTHPVLGTTRTVFQGTYEEAKAYVKEARKRTSLINFAIVKDATELREA
jgi:hypothetical protein